MKRENLIKLLLVLGCIRDLVIITILVYLVWRLNDYIHYFYDFVDLMLRTAVCL